MFLIFFWGVCFLAQPVRETVLPDPPAKKMPVSPPETKGAEPHLESFSSDDSAHEKDASNAELKTDQKLAAMEEVQCPIAVVRVVNTLTN